MRWSHQRSADSLCSRPRPGAVGDDCLTIGGDTAPMVDDLLCGRVTSFRREQGFGVITLDDGRDVPFDASHCTMVPEEGAAVRLRVGPARWGGGIKALDVEPRGW